MTARGADATHTTLQPLNHLSESAVSAIPDPHQAPYTEITRDDWAVAFVGQPPMQESDGYGGIVLYGQCPRCAHSMQVNLPAHYVRGGSPTLSPSPTSVTRIPIMCTCGNTQHTGHPPEEPFGCGAHWVIHGAEEPT